MLSVFAACGERAGSDSSASTKTSQQENTHEQTKAANKGGDLTSAKKDSPSNDAIVLAARESNSPEIPLKAAERFDEDLQLIRKEYPRLADIHARPAFVLDEMLVSLRSGVPWRERWRDGEVQTGDAKLDRFLKEYGADGVDPLLPPETQNREQQKKKKEKAEAFVLHFVSPLNVEALAEKLEEINEKIRYAEPNALVGDGADIDLETSGSEGRKYVFSEGSGDCAAGCIKRRSWTVTLKDSGDLSIEKSGSGSEDSGKGSEIKTF